MFVLGLAHTALFTTKTHRQKTCGNVPYQHCHLLLFYMANKSARHTVGADVFYIGNIFLASDMLRGNGGNQHPHDVIFRV